MPARHRGRYVVMGVAGAGKSAIGAPFAQAMGIDFVEGDRLHPPENVARMAAGIPLTDKDREGWLASIASHLANARRGDAGIVVTCSALKRRYRDTLREAAPDVRFIFLRGASELLRERLQARTGHFMPPALLDSQLATLEAPAPDEAAWEFDIARSLDAIVEALVERARSSDQHETA